jgi:membrane protein DedA with SNARE-associated domain
MVKTQRRTKEAIVLTNLTDTISLFITHLYATTGLAGIVLAMAIESCCIPLPSEIVMPLAGVMLATGKIVSGVNLVVGLALIALAGSIGCLVGSIAAYGIGYAGGRPLMLKYGRYVLISQHDADRADAFFQRWGSATTFFSRLLPVVRTYISLPAGIARMPFVKFCVFTLLGSFPWCLLLTYVGYQLGQISSLGTVFHSLDVVIILAVVILVALYIWRHIRNDRKARAAQAAAALSSAQAMSQPPAQNGWNWQQQAQPSQPPQWGQPQPQPQPFQQPGWGQQPPPQYPQPQPQQPQPGWGQQVSSPPQPRQPQAWSQPPAQQPQPPFQQQGWPAPNSGDGRNGQRQ